MGLEKEIEKIFQRAMESDLELIAQDASADGNTTPQGSCMCACGIVATVTSNDNDTRPEDQLYFIQRIVFKPLHFWDIVRERIQKGDGQLPGPHSESLQVLLGQCRVVEASHKSQLLDKLDNKVAGLITVLSHHYRDEGPSVTIVPRCDWQVISLGVLDYVRNDCLNKKKLEELMKNNQLHIPAIPLDRWPEDIQIDNGTRHHLHYKRADIALRDAHLLPDEDLNTLIPRIVSPDAQTLDNVRNRVGESAPVPPTPAPTRTIRGKPPELAKPGRRNGGPKS
jgi:hypothetical protein